MLIIRVASYGKRIQKTNMFLQEYGKAGTFHMAREIAQNAIDECLDPDSNGKRIEYQYDMATDLFTCEDDGRGFNEEKYDMAVFCTTLQSGSKFFREGDASTSGEFGVNLYRRRLNHLNCGDLS